MLRKNVLAVILTFILASTALIVAAASVIKFSTYLGGSENDVVESVAIDSNGNVYVVGATASTNFPLKNPIQSSLSPTVCGTSPNTFRCGNGFITKFDSNGAVVYSTYFGGTGK